MDQQLNMFFNLSTNSFQPETLDQTSPARNLNVVLLDKAWLENYAAALFPVTAQRLFVEAVLPTTVTVFGLTGNALTVFVYTRPRLWTYANYFLVSLLVVDMLLLVAYFFTSGFWSLYFHGNIRAYGPHTICVHVAYVLCNIFMTASVWFTVLLTIERYLAVCHPFRHMQHEKRKTILITIVVVCVVAILYNILKVFELEAEEITMKDLFNPIIASIFGDSDAQNDTLFEIAEEKLYILTPSNNSRQSLYFIVYRLLCRSTFDTVLPVVVIGVLTTLMCRTLMQANRNRGLYIRQGANFSSSTIQLNLSRQHLVINGRQFSGESAESSTSRRTRTSSAEDGPSTLSSPRPAQATAASTHVSRPNLPLLIVLLKFLLSHILPAVVTILEIIEDEQFFHEGTVAILIVITNFLVVANSATNSLAFLLFSRNVRDELSRLVNGFRERDWLKLTSRDSQELTHEQMLIEMPPTRTVETLQAESSNMKIIDSL